MNIRIPYGHTFLETNIPSAQTTILESALSSYVAAQSEDEIIASALQNPIDASRLCELAEGKSRVLLITSDHTRPVPSKITLPHILEEIRRGNPSAEIKILIATGMHRAMTQEEINEKFGEELVARESFANHNSFEDENMVFKGILPSGGELWLNALVDWADLVVSEGFIEPHFFAGFSGGRKSILPGIASYKTVLANHCAGFIADPYATTGVTAQNPVHRDMLFAAQTVGLSFIFNVVLNPEKRIISAFAGDPAEAHRQGCEFVRDISSVDAAPTDIVITSNGGYPLDQNIYQAVKGMTAAEACASTNECGCIIMVAQCIDGHGGKGFYEYFSSLPKHDFAALERDIKAIPMTDTKPDQWQAQILARVLAKHKVIMVADKNVAEIVADMGMLYADSLDSAIELAYGIAGKDASITVIPDGVGVIVR